MMQDETEQEVSDILQELIEANEVPCLTFLARQSGCRLLDREPDDIFYLD